MIRSFLTVSTGTLASRLLGFARDSMIAALLGPGPVADAFLVAFQLVNVVRRLLSEGALNAALVPAWLRVRETEGLVAAAAFAGRVLGGEKIATPLRVTFDPQMRGFLGQAIPGMIAGAGPQWLVIGGAIIASSSPSAVSWLYFANRLIELPLGIVGVAMGTVLIPELTRALRGNDRIAIAQAESRGLELAVGLALPATLGLIVLSEPIVRMLFEHGAFTALDTMATAHALIWLALGLPAHVLVKALSPAFFAREDTLTPLLATFKGFAVAIVLSVVLSQIFGAGGIAASIAMGAWSSALALIWR